MESKRYRGGSNITIVRNKRLTGAPYTAPTLVSYGVISLLNQSSERPVRSESLKL